MTRPLACRLASAIAVLTLLPGMGATVFAPHGLHVVAAGATSSGATRAGTKVVAERPEPGARHAFNRARVLLMVFPGGHHPGKDHDGILETLMKRVVPGA